MRECLASNIANTAELSIHEYSSVRVFINEQTCNVYGLLEGHKTNFLKNEFSNSSNIYENGILYSGNFNATLQYLGEDQSPYNPNSNGKKLLLNNYYSI